MDWLSPKIVLAAKHQRFLEQTTRQRLRNLLSRSCQQWRLRFSHYRNPNQSTCSCCHQRGNCNSDLKSQVVLLLHRYTLLSILTLTPSLEKVRKSIDNQSLSQDCKPSSLLFATLASLEDLWMLWANSFVGKGLLQPGWTKLRHFYLGTQLLMLLVWQGRFRSNGVFSRRKSIDCLQHQS